MHTKMFIHCSLIRRLATYKVHLCFIVLSVTVCIVGYVCSFLRDQLFVAFVSFKFLSAIIYKFYIHYHDVYVIIFAVPSFRYRNIDLFLNNNC